MKGKSCFLWGFCLIAFLLFSTDIWAVPGGVTYQGKLTNPDGTAVDNGSYSIDFSR